VAASPLALELLSVKEVVRVMISDSFVTVTKNENADWLKMKMQINEAITTFHMSQLPAVNLEYYNKKAQEKEKKEGGEGEVSSGGCKSKGDTDGDNNNSLQANDDDSEPVKMIKELLSSRIRPSVNEDGGDIHFVSFDEGAGIVYVKMTGSCDGCPSSSITLKSGIQQMLMHYIEEVKEVVAIEDDAAADDDGENDDKSSTGKKVELSVSQEALLNFERKLKNKA
jgi:NFU1 iron-sulfur cluster scaffold homolog, mitochondrial